MPWEMKDWRLRLAGRGLGLGSPILLNLILPQHSEEGAMESQGLRSGQ